MILGLFREGTYSLVPGWHDTTIYHLKWPGPSGPMEPQPDCVAISIALGTCTSDTATEEAVVMQIEEMIAIKVCQ